MRLGMQYKRGDVLLIKFPFTTLSASKKRPVLVLKSENEHHDFVCFQITSKSTQNHLIRIEKSVLSSGELRLVSFVKYDKCFTLNSKLVDKKLASLHHQFMDHVKECFCDTI